MATNPTQSQVRRIHEANMAGTPMTELCRAHRVGYGQTLKAVKAWRRQRDLPEKAPTCTAFRQAVSQAAGTHRRTTHDDLFMDR